MQNAVGPTLVAMATTFALGAESNRLTACCLILFNILIPDFKILVSAFWQSIHSPDEGSPPEVDLTGRHVYVCDY